MTFEQLFSRTQPAIPKRGVHLDLKGLPPTADRFVGLLQLFAAARYNVVLVEWEDSFPWTVDERFRSPTAYTPADIRRFTETARDLGLELIPLVQCLGHMETPLSVPGYEHLREIPDFEAGLNPLAPGARELIQKMVDDVLELMPGVRQFHLGGDEARTFGKNPETKAYIEKHGKGALYLHHVEPILDHLNRRGVRPILWHDMMIDWDGQSLRSLAAKCDLMPWGYRGHPDTTEGHFNTKYIKRFN
jgi:hexosaminidase